MKKIIIAFLLVSAVSIHTHTAIAQIRIGVNINIGDQPEWGPSGYDYAEYYYLPDIETYYDVPRRQFIYMSNGQWVFSAGLPARYANYNLYSGYKVVLRDHDAYRNFYDHRVRYARYRHYNDRQPVIRYRHDDGGYKDNGRDNDRGNGRGNRHGRGHERGHD